MKKYLFLALFFAIGISLSAQLSRQFFLVGAFQSSTVVNDSTYTVTIIFQADQTGQGYLPTQITTAHRVIDTNGKTYRVSAVVSSNFTEATLTLVERGSNGAPLGAGYVYNPFPDTEIVPVPPSNAVGISAALLSAILTHNAENTGSGGGSTEQADGATILGDGTPGDPFRVNTDTVALKEELEYARLVQDTILVYYRDSVEIGRDTIPVGNGGGGGGGAGIDDFYRDGDSLRIVSGGDTLSVSAVEADSAVFATLTQPRYDNYRLPAVHEFRAATGLAANESVTNYGFASVNPTFYKFSTTALGTSSTEYGGWLANGTSGDSIAISAPFGVVIGDSQAEGNPAADSRLTNGGAVFSPNYQDVYGTISYTLRQKTNMRWFNHGIGGQTSDQVWARWARDVLGQTFNPSDGRGSKTLQRVPNIVVVIVGINDFYVHNRSWTATAANLENMARSARDNGILAVFLNCPGDEIITEAQARKVDSLNIWMANGPLQAFGAAVVDYNSWWRDPSYNDNAHGQALIVDDIHPSAVGYDSLANVIFRAAKLPVLSAIKFTNELSPLGFSGYSRPANITIQGVAHTISAAQETVLFDTPLAWDSVWVKINSSTDVTGTTYSGFSHIEWLYQNDTNRIVTKRQELYAAYQGIAASLFAKSGGVISPLTVTDRLALGRATAPSVNTVLTVRGTTTDASVNTQFEGSTGLNPIVFTNNGRVGINRTGASYNLHVNGNMASETVSGYSFWNGPTSEVFGATPRIRMQSTNFNTGGTGRTDIDLFLDGNVYTMAPSSSASGGDFRFRIRNKLSSYFFTVDVGTARIGNVLTPAYGVDFSASRDGLVIPSGTTSQRGSTGGVLYAFRMNTDSSQVEFTPSSSTWNYIPRSAYPVKTSGVTIWSAGGILGRAIIGSGLSFSGDTLRVNFTDTNVANTELTTPAGTIQDLFVGSGGGFRIRGTSASAAFRLDDDGSVDLYSDEFVKVETLDSVIVKTPALQINNGTAGPGGIDLYEDRDNGVNFAKIQAPATLAANYTLTLPGDDGTAGQALTTNGSGVLSWSTIAGYEKWTLRGGSGSSPDINSNDALAIVGETESGISTRVTANDSMYIDFTPLITNVVDTVSRSLGSGQQIYTNGYTTLAHADLDYTSGRVENNTGQTQNFLVTYSFSATSTSSVVDLTAKCQVWNGSAYTAYKPGESVATIASAGAAKEEISKSFVLTGVPNGHAIAISMDTANGVTIYNFSLVVQKI
jgi:lysophospholipase L1-like esterase